MLANRVVLRALLKKQFPVNVLTSGSHSGSYFNERLPLGNREWVGYGMTSMPNYADRYDFPMPAIRFKEITGELVALREKEKGDWKKLTLEEKKKLYRASFCQTLTEAEAPTGLWKSVLGFSLIFISLGVWVFIIEKLFFYKPKPKTTEDSWRAASLRKKIDLRYGHLTGISSVWDYEKDDWKKK